MTSKNILIVANSNGQNPSSFKELEKEGFAISISHSAEEALKDGINANLIVLDLKLNNKENIELVEKFKSKHTPLILCSEEGKDKMSFQIWASEAKVVKSGDHEGLKWAIKETIG
ncbi:MAG: response regulator [Nitrospinota bacterium]